MDLQCLPVIYPNEPNKIVSTTKALIKKYQIEYAEILIIYADFGTGSQLQNLCDGMGLSMISGQHCYSFYEGNANFEARQEFAYFYLTYFLVRKFDAFFWRPMGLGRHPQLLQMYFGHYTTLVYQAQIQDALLEKKAKDCARSMKSNYEYRFTGFGDLAVALDSTVE